MTVVKTFFPTESLPERGNYIIAGENIYVVSRVDATCALRLIDVKFGNRFADCPLPDALERLTESFGGYRILSEVTITGY